jgi:hypothetical protein
MTATPESFDSRRLQELIAERCNGTLDDAGGEELERILAASHEARLLYWKCVDVHAGIDWELAHRRTDSLAASTPFPRQWSPEGDERPELVGSRRRWSKVRAHPWRVVAAACALGVVSWALTQPWSSRTSAAAPVLGTISALSPGSQWSFGNLEESNRAEFRAGETVSVKRGAIELRLINNAVAQLEAPLILELQSVDRARVFRGRVTVNVPKGAEGFTVETPSAEVIDLGTNFSVDVDGSETDVVVFQGEVDLIVSAEKPGDASPTARTPKRLRMGEALRVSEDGTFSRIVNVMQTDFTHRRVEAPLISAVRDNVERPETWDFYQVVPQGMGEDARAYVDRRHEWNGWAGRPMPAYLVGADYVRTFNNDKIADNLVIEVTVEHPATIYLLMDNRAPAPEWLMRDFEDTGEDLGMDEAWHDPLNFVEGQDDFPGVGSGQSVDRRISIWKRQVSAGVVTLGPNGKTSDVDMAHGLKAGRNMYGIVAVPVEQPR